MVKDYRSRGAGSNIDGFLERLFDFYRANRATAITVDQIDVVTLEIRGK